MCLISSLVSRVPSTPYLMRSYRRRAAHDLAAGDPTFTTANAGELPGEHRAGVVAALRATTAAPWYMEELAVEKELGLGRVSVFKDGEGANPVPALAVAAVGGDAAVKSHDGSGGSGGAGGVDIGGLRSGVEQEDEGCSGGDMDKEGSEECHGGGLSNDDGAEDPTTVHSLEAAEADAAALARACTNPADASRVAADLRFIDGAIACNNPTAVGIFEARRLYSRHRPLCVVSLGTGAAVPREVPPNLGASSWVQNVVSATCDVVQVDATVRHVLGAGDHYFRFQPTGEVFGCALNDTSEATRDELRMAAQRYMDTDAVQAEVAELAALLRRW